MQQLLIDLLFGVRDVMTELLVNLRPVTDDDRTALSAMMVRRDRLTRAIMTVIEADISASTAGIDAAIQKVTDASTKLGQLKKTLDNVNSAIAIVDGIVQIASSVVTGAAA